MHRLGSGSQFSHHYEATLKILTEATLLIIYRYFEFSLTLQTTEHQYKLYKKHIATFVLGQHPSVSVLLMSGIIFHPT